MSETTTTTTNTNKFRVEGRVIWAGEIITGTGTTGKTWKKAQFIIEYSDGANIIPMGFTAWNNATDIVERLKENDIVNVMFSIESRTHENKLYTDLKAYYIQIQFSKKWEKANT